MAAEKFRLVPRTGERLMVWAANSECVEVILFAEAEIATRVLAFSIY